MFCSGQLGHLTWRLTRLRICNWEDFPRCEPYAGQRVPGACYLAVPERLVPTAHHITVVLSLFIGGSVGKVLVNFFMVTSADYFHHRKQPQGRAFKKHIGRLTARTYLTQELEHSLKRQGDTTQYREAYRSYSITPGQEPL